MFISKKHLSRRAVLRSAFGIPGQHLGASAGWLNGLGAQGAQGAPIVSGKTLDQFIADRIGADAPMPSLEIGTEDMGTSIGACDGFSCVYFNCLAWRSNAAPLPVEINPRVTFESRVFTFLTGVEASNRGYNFIGVPESHHVCSHHENNAEAMEKYAKIVTYQVEQFARFVSELSATPDGDGSLLDHSLLYYGGGMSNGNVHDRYNPPAVILGGANGRLQGDRYIAVANRAPAANLLLNIAEMADVRVEHIGPSTGKLDL